jgi:orotate phosphoribosyltransferase
LFYNQGHGMTDHEVLSIFRTTGALLDGHFQLTSGLHSPQYFQCARVLQYPRHLEQVCGEIAGHFRSTALDAVIAPALGGIVVGVEVGRQLGLRTMFAERSDGRMQLRRGFAVVPGERVLVCEDVVTTGGSVDEVIGIVRALGGVPAAVGYLVDRSGGTVRFAVPDQFALLHMDVVTYKPGACPLCAAGQPAVKPGSRAAQ